MRSGGPAPVNPDYRPDIDGLRAVAVLSVVGYHAFPKWVPGGFVGVDVFFVISGFLISTILFRGLEHGRFDLADFYGRRIRRIFPALALVLAACLALGWFMLLPEEYRELGRHVAGGAAFLSNFVLWREAGYFDSAAELKPLLHLWSLGIEEQFYIVWPLLLWAAWRRLPLWALTLAIIVLSFGLNLYWVRHDLVAVFYAPHTRFWELLIGAGLAWWALRAPPVLPLPHILSGTGLLLILAAAFLLDQQRPFPGWWALAPTLGAALLIAAGPAALPNRLLLGCRPMVWVGLISFPLYLWHWPLLAFLRITEGGTPPRMARIFAVLAAVLLAWATWRLVERPLRFGGGRRAKVAALVAAMVLVGGFGAYVHHRNGFDGRFNTAMSEEELAAQRRRYWNDTESSGFGERRTNIVLFGDSQAIDAYQALRNDPDLGLKLYRTPHECSGFFTPDKGNDTFADRCRAAFEALAASPEIARADALIYAHFWLQGFEVEDNYRLGLERLRARNPGLRVFFFGHKPLIGDAWISINAITRSHRSTVGMNDFLLSKMNRREADDGYARGLARQLGARFVDVTGIFCRGGCPLYEANAFSYFDQTHWTEAGAQRFFEKLRQTEDYRALAGSR